MTALAIALAALGIYLLAGVILASRRLPIMWQKARRQWTIEPYVRGSVKAQFLVCLFCWPISVAVSHINEFLNRYTVASDPVRRASKLDERERRIRQLERELGIRP